MNSISYWVHSCDWSLVVNATVGSTPVGGLNRLLSDSAGRKLFNYFADAINITLLWNPALDEPSQGIFFAPAATLDDIFHKVVIGYAEAI